MSCTFTPSRCHIRLGALVRNFSRMGRPDRLMPVIKSDAYGHGMTEVAHALDAAGARHFAVGTVAEGICLRQDGLAQTILPLLGCQNDEDWQQASACGLTPLITGFEALEKAAALRDRIRAISVLGKQQQVIAGVCADTDVWGVYVGQVRSGCAVLHIEDGNLLGREVEVFPTAADEALPAVLAAVLQQYYLERGALPSEILLPEPVEDMETLAALLTGRAGHRVTLRVPQRGERAELLRMAGRNAREEVERITSDAERVNKTLEQLQQLAGLPVLPRRMESYDISHTAGQDMVASMVVFADGKPLKRDYRRFQIKSLDHADDLRALQEVLQRRMQRYLDGDEHFSPLPDLLLMDGGHLQAQATQQQLESMGIHVPILGMVKDDRHRTRALVTPEGRELGIQQSPPLFALVGRVQEEVHRFAITYHHEKHSRSAMTSRLDGIPGIGDVRKKALLKHFKSVKAISQAELVQLEALLPKAAARAVYDHFHEKNT